MNVIYVADNKLVLILEKIFNHKVSRSRRVADVYGMQNVTKVVNVNTTML